MSRTPCYNVQLEQGARFAVWQGVEIPEVFSSVNQESEALRGVCGVCDLSGSTVLCVHGKDTADFLHRIVTQTVKTLPVGQGTYSTVLRGDGRMIADTMIYRSATNEFWLTAPPVCRANLVAQLEKYVILEDVLVSDASNEYALFSVDGPAAMTTVMDALGTRLAGCTVGQCYEVSKFGKNCLVGRRNSLRGSGFEVLVPHEVAPDVWNALSNSSLLIEGAPTGITARERVRVEQGIPLYGLDLEESIIPLEAGLTSAIDFTKGCFPGQEIVARIENLGHPAKVFIGLQSNGDLPLPGAEIQFEGRVVGRVTSVADSDRCGRIALGYVKWDQRAAGTVVQIVTANCIIAATVIEPPFPTRS